MKFNDALEMVLRVAICLYILFVVFFVPYMVVLLWLKSAN